MEVIKVQRPLDSPFWPWLVYNRDKSRMQLEPQENLSDDVKRAMGSDVKGYFEAAWEGNRWVIGPRLDDQDW